MESKKLGRAPNGEKESLAEKWIANALTEFRCFADGFVQSQNWVVVPVESGQHLESTDAAGIAKAAAMMGTRTLRAVLLEDAKNVRNHLAVDVSQDGLLIFNRECAHFNYILLPENHSFAIVCTTDDYFLVAGPKEFVVTAIGTSIARAQVDFLEYATDESWPESVTSYLLEVAQRCGIPRP